jgi:hypothetical protein
VVTGKVRLLSQRRNNRATMMTRPTLAHNWPTLARFGPSRLRFFLFSSLPASFGGVVRVAVCALRA